MAHKSFSTASGVLPWLKPSRCATRKMCVSTASAGRPKPTL